MKRVIRMGACGEFDEMDYDDVPARRSLSCSDGYCGAYDCERCRPGCTRESAIECPNCHESHTNEGDGQFCSVSCAREWELDRAGICSETIKGGTAL